MENTVRESTNWRILHLEDNEFDRELVRRALLKEGARPEFVYASSHDDFANALAAGDYDVILSDFTLPAFDGATALTLAREQRPDVPCIFVSGTIGEERAVETMKSGATDYVLKDRLNRLLPAIERALREADERRQRRTAEQALRESEERYRSLFERHPQPMWIFDVETLRFLAVNDAAIAHYGYAREEFLRMTIADIRPPEDVPALLDDLKSPAPDRAAHIWRHRKKDGSIIEVEITAHDVVSGGRAGRVVNVNDITQRRQTEERFTTIFHSAPVAIGYGKMDGTIIDVNHQLCEFLGHSRDEMIGRTVQALHIWATPDQPRAVLEKLRKEKVLRNQELKFRRKSGEVRTGLLSVEVIHFANDPLLLAMIVDVTERKSLEAQLQRANRVESVGRLASGIAHDMNNILAPIMMAAPLLRLNRPSAEMEKTLATIEVSAKRGADLVRQLLTFSRGIEGERCAVRPHDLIREITKIAGETFPKNITINTRLARDLWPVRGDTSQLHQILLNLCVNARDAMPRGGMLTIAADNLHIDENFVRMHGDAKPGLFVRLSVSDTGTGIPPAIMDRIFDPFFTTKEVGHGTGLGLSTVLGIVQGHGGFVSLCSEIDHGATFEVFLPATPGATGSTGLAAGPPLPRGKNELILVVDDEESIRTVLRETLLQFGYRVVIAGDGAEATVVFARNLADVKMVITDLDMPVMDGVSLLKVIKRMKPDVPAIVSTGMASTKTSQERAAELHTLGVKTILRKPYTAESILTAVHKKISG